VQMVSVAREVRAVPGTKAVTPRMRPGFEFPCKCFL
jgi:hypothetical protein